MKIRDVMTPDAVAAHPETTLMAASEMMRLLNVGSLPDVMTRNVQTCSVNEDVEDVAHQMRDLQVRRLLVVDEQERLIGIVSLGDLAMEMEDQRLAGRVLEGISESSTSLAH
jgi:CBS domain-containing protein